jgi:hypothetical protein
MIQFRMDASRKRLLYYLLLNVLVSACVTVSILFVYDRYYRPATVPERLTQVDGAPTLEISAVVGAGIPSSETVILRNTGTTQANLKSWTLQDEDSNVYTFADITILPNGSIQLHTAPGKGTRIDLYWGLTAPAWRSGETVTLLDPAGSVRSVYKVP